MQANTKHISSAGTRSLFTKPIASHPTRDLLNHLRELAPVSGRNESDPISFALKQSLSEDAETVMAVCQNGMAALGQLLAHSSPVIEDGTVSAESVEALGWLIAELGDLTAYCLVLAADCRREPSCSGLSKVA